MKTLLISACVLALTGAAYAHPGHGAGGGPPAGATFGPPAAAMAHIPNGVANGFNDNGVGAAANLLGKLNAAHASPTALAHASPNSIVGELGAYKAAMLTDEANLQSAQAAVTADEAKITSDTATFGAGSSQVAADNAQLATDEAAVAAAQAAIAAEEASLAQIGNKPLTPAVIAQVNTLLGL
jgi:hypothetical protein